MRKFLSALCATALGASVAVTGAVPSFAAPIAPIQGNIGFDPDAPSVRVVSAVERMTKYVPKRGEVIGVVGNVHVAADGSIMSEITLDGTNHRLLPDELWRNRND